MKMYVFKNRFGSLTETIDKWIIISMRTGHSYEGKIIAADDNFLTLSTYVSSHHYFAMEDISSFRFMMDIAEDNFEEKKNGSI